MAFECAFAENVKVAKTSQRLYVPAGNERLYHFFVVYSNEAKCTEILEPI